MKRGLLVLTVTLGLAAPGPASAGFSCERSVQLQASWCASSLITSIPQREATLVCTDYTNRLATQCRPDWDQFKSCREFADRFARLLVKTCQDHKLGKKACQHWGDAYLVGPLGRCERGKTSY
jgi:hypothetical protein